MSFIRIHPLADLTSTFQAYSGEFKKNYNKDVREYPNEFLIFLIDRINQNLVQSISSDLEGAKRRISELESKVRGLEKNKGKDSLRE